MIEIALLDQLETLTARYPRLDISNMTMKNLGAYDATVVGSLGETILQNRLYFSSSISPDATKIYLSANSGLSPYKSLVFDITAETIAFDDSVGRGFAPIVPDQSGAIWANGTRPSYYGIWRRTGVATWTNTLSDAAAGSFKYKPDGTLYYLSSTSNWYLLSGGTATLIGAPTGYYAIPATQYLEFPTTEGRTAGDFIDATGTVISALGLIDLNYISAQTQVFYTQNVIVKKQCKIDATYSLFVCQPAIANTFPKYYLYLVNKMTSTQKFIGSINNPTLALNVAGAITTQQQYDLFPIFAKLESGFLRIYWLGIVAQLAANNVSTSNQFGMVKTNIPYTPDI